MLSTGRVTGTSGLKDAILDCLLPVRSYNNTDSYMGLLNLENIVIAVGILFLSCLQAEIEVFRFWRPPSWISHFRLSRTTFPVVSLDRWTQKHQFGC